MGFFRFRRRVHIAPGINLNLSKGLPSLSIGGHGFTENISARGLKTTIGLPGSGLSYQTKTTPWSKGGGGTASPTPVGVDAQHPRLYAIRQEIESLTALTNDESLLLAERLPMFRRLVELCEEMLYHRHGIADIESVLARFRKNYRLVTKWYADEQQQREAAAAQAELARRDHEQDHEEEEAQAGQKRYEHTAAYEPEILELMGTLSAGKSEFAKLLESPSNCRNPLAHG